MREGSSGGEGVVGHPLRVEVWLEVWIEVVELAEVVAREWHGAYAVVK